MLSSLTGIILAFDCHVSVDSGKEQSIVASPQHKLIFQAIPGLRRALFALARDGATVQNMSEWIQEDRGEFGVFKFYQYLQKFTSFGWLCHTVMTKGCRIATAKPMTIDARFLPIVAVVDSPRETLRERHYILSKFAYIH
jgi:ThcOx helix turn helix domain